jgi:NAD(P)-dependent dehydrogenase (short-subunit alcohol dehydrogenase family)
MVMERGVEAGSYPEVYQQVAELHPITRLGRSEEIAEAAVWLCSEAASFVTGHAMTADGGYAENLRARARDFLRANDQAQQRLVRHLRL